MSILTFTNLTTRAYTDTTTLVVIQAEAPDGDVFPSIKLITAQLSGLQDYTQQNKPDQQIISNGTIYEISLEIQTPANETSIPFSLRLSGQTDSKQFDETYTSSIQIAKYITSSYKQVGLSNYSRGPHVVLSFELNNTTQYITFDTQDAPSASRSIQVASQPIYNGQTMIDHLYRNPSTYKCSGSMGLITAIPYNGEYGELGIDGTTGQKLNDFEVVMTYLMNEGILCTLTILEGSATSGESRFARYTNMLLKDCTFTYQVTSLKFSFNFIEVIQVAIQEEATSTLAELNQYPTIYTPDPVSLHQFVLDSTEQTDSANSMMALLFDYLMEKGYISKKGTQAICNIDVNNAKLYWEDVGKSILTNLQVAGYIVGFVAAGVVGTAIAGTVTVLIAAKVGAVTGLSALVTTTTGTAVATTTTSAAVANIWNPVLWVVIAIVLIAALVVLIVSFVKKKKKVKWKLVNNIDNLDFNKDGKLTKGALSADNINDSDIEELYELFERLCSKFKKAESDMVVYELYTDSDNSTTSALIDVDGLAIEIDCRKIPIEITRQNCGPEILHETAYYYNFDAKLYGLDEADGFHTGKNHYYLYNYGDGGNTNHLCKYITDDYTYYVYIYYIGDTTEIKQTVYGTAKVNTDLGDLHNYYILVSRGTGAEAAEKMANVLQDILNETDYNT